MRFALWLLTLFLWSPLPASAGVSIGALYGGQLNCNEAIEACHGIPLTITTFCTNGNANCPSTWHPSLTDGARFWGARTTSCVTSTDTGATWGACTTQPFAGDAPQVAGAGDGSVIAVASVAGTCTIKRSINNGSSWSTQFTDGAQCTFGAGSSQVLVCHSTGRCDFGAVVSGTARTYLSSDHGVSWALSNHGGAVTAAVFGITFDEPSGLGLFGANPTLGLKTVVASGGTWGLSAAWPAAANNYGAGTSMIFSSVPNMITHDVIAANYKRLTSDGTVSQTFTPTGALVTSSPALSVLEYSPGLYYLVGFRAGGLQRFWISTDSLLSTIVLGDNAQAGGRATMRRIGRSVYFSVFGGAFYKIS